MPRRYAPRVITACATCGASVSTKPSLARLGVGKYCGPDCRAQGQMKHGEAGHALGDRSRKIDPSIEYRTYMSMRSRCLNPNHPAWKHYGGRGITIEAAWLESYEAFLNDMGRRPGKGYSLERRDNSLGYFRENCYWATSYEQAANKRTTRWLTSRGITATLTDWAEKIGISPEGLAGRIDNLGWSVDRALNTPSRGFRVISLTHDGQTHSVAAWAKIIGIPNSTIINRLKRGWSSERALTTPPLATGKNAQRYHG